MAINEKYTKKDWRGQSFRTVDPEEFNNSTIRRAIFSQIEPYTKIFPQGMTGVHFLGCNLANAVVPPGNTMEGGCNQQQAEQNDGEMWHVDKAGNPLSPVKPDRFDKWEISKDPVDIPAVKVPGQPPRTVKAEQDRDLLLTDLRMDTDKLLQILKDEGKI